MGNGPKGQPSLQVGTGGFAPRFYATESRLDLVGDNPRK
jgi:hypothetical protein